MDILKRVRQAQQQLRSTQINWQEACLFNCDEMLSDIIRELEAAEHGVQLTGLSLCPECSVEQIVAHKESCSHYESPRN